MLFASMQFLLELDVQGGALSSWLPEEQVGNAQSTPLNDGCLQKHWKKQGIHHDKLS